MAPPVKVSISISTRNVHKVHKARFFLVMKLKWKARLGPIKINIDRDVTFGETGLIARPVHLRRSLGNYSKAALQYSATAAPIEQCSRLSEPYNGFIGDCFKRTMQDDDDEGVVALWRGNTANNVIRYLVTQALFFEFKDYFKRLFNFNKDKDDGLTSGGAAAVASSLLFAYSLDYALTRLANVAFDKDKPAG